MIYSLTIPCVARSMSLTDAAIRNRLNYAPEGSIARVLAGPLGKWHHSFPETVARLRLSPGKKPTAEQIEELAVRDVEFRARQADRSLHVGEDAARRARYVISALTPDERERFETFRRKMTTSLTATFWQQAVFSSLLDYLDATILNGEVAAHVLLGNTTAPEVENGWAVSFVLSNLFEGTQNPFHAANAA
ncbi:hypothetical protein EF888_06930 [Silicimonas algicola]|uniref:Uncharacterized protein n=1 Tax=Silicimonas algicola TaxID=1826607 RepID=A0A316G5Y0_9RHOB|nr:hypothetical protein [Silicimonas algicola]AZQ66896.1 hypothetical protein EF888_06930 [Silicimonas algicola]PWK55190.1 hypothetical protein C8D95_10869 [Silicimonas algicola]